MCRPALFVLSFLSLTDIYMLFARLMKEGTHLLLLLTLVLVLLVIHHLYVRCPAYCRLLCLSCPLAVFSWLDASRVQMYVLVSTTAAHVAQT